jgi:hypothetical protein
MATLPQHLQQNRNVTFSGYAKNEVYKDIEGSFHKSDYERLCYLTAELACTRNELNHLMQHLVDEFVQHRLSSNLTHLKYVIDTMNILQGFPKKNLAYNNSFQRTLCELVMHIAITSKKHTPLLMENVDFVKHIEPLLYKFGARHEEQISSVFKSKVSNDLLKHLQMLYYFLRKGELKYCLIMASYLVMSKEHFVDEIDFFEIKDIKKQNKKDIVWYLWKLALTHTEAANNASEKNQGLYTYTLQALRLYTRLYNKRNRLSRVNLLLYSFVVICNKMIKEKPVKKHILRHAADKIHIVYQEILGVEDCDFIKQASTSTNGLVITQGKQVGIGQGGNTSGSNVTTTSTSTANSSTGMDYLKFYTNYDDALANMIRQRNEDVAEIKTVEYSR